MSDSSRPLVSVIIVTYNSRNSLPDTLDGLEANITEIENELVIVDNNSDDGSIEYILNRIPHAVIIKNDRNDGFAKACNLAAANATGEFLLFHNPDLKLDHGAIGRLTAFLTATEQVGALSGRMRFPNGSFQATCRNLPTTANILFSRGSLLSRIVRKESVYTLPDYPDPTEVEAVAGTLLLIKRAVFSGVGGFDNRFFMYMEDSDLCLRLRQAGYKNYFFPDAGGVHLWGKGSRAGMVRRAWYHHLSVWKYFLKHFPNAFSLLFLPLLLLANFVIGVIVNGLNKSENA